MVNVSDILDRSQALEKKYTKYLEEEKPKQKPVTKSDQYQVEYDECCEAATKLAEDAVLVGELRDRSRKASGNAEVRKRKAALIERIKGLEGLVKKGKVEKAIVGTRQQDIQALQARVDAIPDGGVNIGRKQPGQSQLPKRSMLGKSGAGEVRIELGDMGGANGDAAYYQDTEENVAFRKEFEQRKLKQDEALDEIEVGVSRLGNIATDMGQELNKQDKLFDEVEAQMDSATKAVQTNNQKLKGVLARVRSQRNFCIDIILITVLLAVAGYIYSVVG